MEVKTELDRLEAEVGELYRQFAHSLFAQLELETMLEEVGKAHAEKLETIRSEQKKQDDTLKRLYSKLDLMAAVSMSNSTYLNPSIVTHRHLNDARFCVIAGLMEVYPEVFTKDNSLYRYDTSWSTPDWESFLDVLHEHFLAHHQEGADGRYIQTRSAFASLSPSCIESDISDDMRGEVESHPIDLPDNSLFSEQVEVAFWMKGEYENMSKANQSGIRELLWLLPAVIWTYNSFKKSVLKEDAEIHELKKLIRAQNRLLTRYKYKAYTPSDWTSDDPVDIRMPFTWGTGLALRQRGEWKQYMRLPHKHRDGDDRHESLKHKFEDTRNNNKASHTCLSENSPPVMVGALFIAHGRDKSTNSGDDINDGEGDVHQNANVDTVYWKLEGSESKEDEIDIKIARGNALHGLEGAKKELAEAQKRRDAYLISYMFVRRCLAILVDTDLLKLVLFGHSLVQELTKKSLHKSNNYSPHALGDVEMPGEKEHGVPEQYVETVGKLGTLIRSGEPANVHDVSLEKAIDENLEEGVKKYIGIDVPRRRKVISDLYLLLLWLEDLHPSTAVSGG